MKNPNASPTLKRGFGLSSFGRSEGIRTPDILLPKALELLVSIAFASFLMRSNYF